MSRQYLFQNTEYSADSDGDLASKLKIESLLQKHVITPPTVHTCPFPNVTATGLTQIIYAVVGQAKYMRSATSRGMFVLMVDSSVAE